MKFHYKTRLRMVELQNDAATYAKMAREAREQFLEYRGWPRMEGFHLDRYHTYSRRAAQCSRQAFENYCAATRGDTNMPSKPLTQEVIDKVKAAGFDVYMYEPNASWLIYTDGTRVAYLQDNRFGGLYISTKHHPDKHHGSGFVAVERLEVNDLTREILEQGFMIMPHWADHRYPVRKYKNIQEYLGADYFNSRYRKV